MSAHTPGPWTVPHFARPDVDCECGYVLTDGYMGAVATVHCSGKGNPILNGDNPKFDEAVANAYLISSAPDLLSAAKNLDEFAWSAVTPDCKESAEYLQKLIDALRTAIAKAEGRTESLPLSKGQEEGNG